MPTTTPETFPYGKRGWYPHMKPNDVAIWERFIEKFPDAYDFVAYDVVCGDTPDFDVTAGGVLGEDTKKLYQKKIDVVGYKGVAIDVIEIGPRMGAAKVGQVKNYCRLFKRDYSPPEKPGMIVLTDEVQPSVADFAEEEGVRIIIV